MVVPGHVISVWLIPTSRAGSIVPLTTAAESGFLGGTVGAKLGEAIGLAVIGSAVLSGSELAIGLLSGEGAIVPVWLDGKEALSRGVVGTAAEVGWLGGEQDTDDHAKNTIPIKTQCFTHSPRAGCCKSLVTFYLFDGIHVAL